MRAGNAQLMYTFRCQGTGGGVAAGEEALAATMFAYLHAASAVVGNLAQL